MCIRDSSLVDWSQEELAKAAAVALTSVRDIEGEKRAADSGTVANVRRALENEGVEFLAGAEDHGPGVRLAGDRPNVIRRPTVVTMWEGMPVEIEFKGKTFDAFISYEVLEDLGRLTKKEPDEDVYKRQVGRGAQDRSPSPERQCRPAIAKPGSISAGGLGTCSSKCR